MVKKSVIKKRAMITNFLLCLRERFDSHHRKGGLTLPNEAKNWNCCFLATLTITIIDAKMENASSVKNFKIVLWKYNSVGKSIFQKVCKGSV
jgi:hypothetical protein